jgi:hypothetical protein
LVRDSASDAPRAVFVFVGGGAVGGAQEALIRAVIAALTARITAGREAVRTGRRAVVREGAAGVCRLVTVDVAEREAILAGAGDVAYALALVARVGATGDDLNVEFIVGVDFFDDAGTDAEDLEHARCSTAEDDDGEHDDDQDGRSQSVAVIASQASGKCYTYSTA